jgi:pilus assembly protein CpaF
MRPELLDVPPPDAGLGGDDDAVVAAVHAEAAAGALGSRADVAERVREQRPLAPAAVIEVLTDRVYQRLAGLGALEPILADPAVTEVLVNGPGVAVWVERAGRLEPTDVVLDRASVDLVVERIVGPLGLRADRAHPLVDARLADGSRANVVVPPLALDGPVVTIRRFGARAVDLADLCPPGVDELLVAAVRARWNIVACGGTGAGKTTLLNALAAHVPAAERIVTVEDAAELRLAHPHVVRLEARLGSGATHCTTIRELVRNALRMRPDRIVIGEIRGAEALDLVQAMNTGHEGALSTLHANSPVDAIARLETLVLYADVGLPLDAVRRQLGAALDLVVHVARLADGRRRVVEVAEIGDLSQPGDGVRRLADAAGVVGEASRPPRHHHVSLATGRRQ